MKEDIINEIASSISKSYYEVLINGFKEEENEFHISICIINFIINLREKNIICNIDDIFVSSFLDKIIIEANKYIGR